MLHNSITHRSRTLFPRASSAAICRAVRIGLLQKKDDVEHTGLHRSGGRPLGALNDIQADAAITVHVRVVHLAQQSELGNFERIAVLAVRKEGFALQ